MSNNQLTKTEFEIENMIYEVNGVQVMLDNDLAKLYGVETKRINEAVKNNLNKFPERFSWLIDIKEYENLRSKISTSSLDSNYGGRRHKIRVFTEQGVAMLATILKSKIAVEVSIRVMDAFVLMRRYLKNNNYDKRISNLETKYIEYDNNFDIIFDKLDKSTHNHLFFEGQLYDAYSLLLDILNSANDEIIIIDNYIDKKILDITSKSTKKVLIITSNKSGLTEEDIKTYKKQYSNVYIRFNNRFHDRFIIIDRKVLYHSGASFKDIGKKCFAINKITTLEYLTKLLSII